MSFTVVICRAYSKDLAETRCETLYVNCYDALISLINDWLGDADVLSYHIFQRTDR